MSTEKNTVLKNKLGQELSNYDATYDINFDLIGEEILHQSKNSLSTVQEIIEANPIKTLSEEKELEIYQELTKYGRDLRDDINGLKVKYEMIGTLAKEISKIVRNANYSAETLFWGIKIEQNILNKLDKSKFTTEDTQSVECSIIELVMLHSILMNEPIKGLSFESYLVAKATVDITEFVKAYNFLNVQADKVVQAIKTWETSAYVAELNPVT